MRRSFKIIPLRRNSNRFSSKLRQSLNDKDESKKLKRLTKIWKKTLNVFRRKTTQITLLALGLGVLALVLAKKENRQFIICYLARFKSLIKSSIFSSSDEENSQIIDQKTSPDTGQKTTTKLLVLFGTILTYLIYSKYKSDDVSIDLSIDEISSSGGFYEWFKKYKEWIRLISVLVTIAGLVVPVPGPVGVPNTNIDNIFIVGKRVFQLVGYTGSTMQDD